MNAFRKTSNEGRSGLTYSTNFIKKQAEQKSKKKFDKKELESCIQKLKQTSAKNTQHLQTDKKQSHNQQLYENYAKYSKRSSKQRQRSVKRLERVLSNKQDSIRRSSKNSHALKNNVYDSFSMSNKFLEMSSTPDNKTRYASNNNLTNSSDVGVRKR